MIAPTITGNFNASGGSGNDIQAVIADEENYTQLDQRPPGSGLSGTTQGKQTTGNIEARLKPACTIWLSATSSRRLRKSKVFLDVDLNYKKAERTTGAASAKLSEFA